MASPCAVAHEDILGHAQVIEHHVAGLELVVHHERLHNLRAILAWYLFRDPSCDVRRGVEALNLDVLGLR